MSTRHSLPLESLRRLTVLADRVGTPEAVHAVLASELLRGVGVQEVHLHHPSEESDSDLVVVNLLEGDGRLTYLCPRPQRQPGVSWVLSARQSLVTATEEDLSAWLPRLAETGTAAYALALPMVVSGDAEAVVVLVRHPGASAFDQADVELAATLVDQGATALALVQARAEAGTDAVTGSLNRRAMRRRLAEEMNRSRRTGQPLACLIADLDNFKEVNDRHGHHAGDAMLRSAARALQGEFRAYDRVARYGGDEFVVILPNAGLDSATAAAERALARLRQAQSAAPLPFVTASIGVAQWHPSMSVDAFLQAGDAALLASKRAGKGRVTVAAPLAQSA
jgi:diguanylate cyclase (GGDEF)-like protein